MTNPEVDPTAGSPADHTAIRKLAEDWVLYRDAGFWKQFESVWHDDGWMSTTWFQGPFREFIAVSREGFDHGVQIAHFLGGWTCDLAGARAVSQTKMKIEQRATIDGIEVDVTCTGRFYDFVEFREGRWGIVRRQPIYERDRLDVVDPAQTLAIDPAVIARYPAGYRYLAYMQELIGFTVIGDLPGTRGPEVEALYREGVDWLAGSAAPGVVPPR